MNTLNPKPRHRLDHAARPRKTSRETTSRHHRARSADPGPPKRGWNQTNAPMPSLNCLVFLKMPSYPTRLSKRRPRRYQWACSAHPGPQKRG